MSVDIRRFRILERKHQELEEIQRTHRNDQNNVEQVARLEKENHIKSE